MPDRAPDFTQIESPPNDPIDPALDAPQAPKKRRGRLPGSSNKRRAPALGDIRKGATEALGLVNGMVIATMMPTLPPLEPDEIELLAGGIAAEIEGNPKLAKWLARAAGIGPHAQLLRAVLLIAYPRLVQHGIIPIPGRSNPATAVSVETGGAHGDSGGHRDGQDNIGGQAPIGTPIHAVN